MNHQTELFEMQNRGEGFVHFKPVPYRSESPTSEAAAKRAASSPKLGSDRRRVYDAILAAGAHGRTRQELADRLGMKIQTVCARVNDLMRCEPPLVVGTKARRCAPGQTSAGGVVVAVKESLRE